MQDSSTSASDMRRAGGRLVTFGITGIVALLVVAALLLLLALPDAGAFDARVERIFIENSDLTSPAEIKLLEILAQSGTCLLYTSPSPRDRTRSRMPSSA